MSTADPPRPHCPAPDEPDETAAPHDRGNGAVPPLPLEQLPPALDGAAPEPAADPFAHDADEDDLADPAGRAARAQRARDYGFLTLAELATLPPLRWRISQMLVEHTVSCFFGAPGEGKSFAVIDIALHIATARSYHGGGTVTPTPVLFVAAEAAHGLFPRIDAWTRHYDLPLPDSMLVFPKPLDLLDDPAVDAFIAAVTDSAFQPGVIVIDTLAPCINVGGGDESATPDMGRAMTAAHRIATALLVDVIFVHHTGRQGEHARGSNSLDGACDSMFRVEQTGTTVCITNTKQRSATLLPPLYFTRTVVPLGTDPDTGEPRTSCVLVPAEPPGTAPVFSPKERQALLALAAVSRRFGPAGVPAKEWHMASGLSRSTFWKTAPDLVTRGYVLHDARGPYSLAPKARTWLAQDDPLGGAWPDDAPVQDDPPWSRFLATWHTVFQTTPQSISDVLQALTDSPDGPLRAALPDSLASTLALESASHRESAFVSQLQADLNARCNQRFPDGDRALRLEQVPGGPKRSYVVLWRVHTT